MSTETQQTTLGFAEAPIQKLPRLACIGKVTEVLEGKEASTGNYVVQGISIKPSGPGRATRLQLLYRPEWLDAKYDPTSMLEYDGGDKMFSVYQRHIAKAKGTSNLKGLCGSDEAYAQLSNLLLTAEDKSIQGVQDILREFFTVTNEDMLFGYVLQQKTQKVTDPDTGKVTYEPDNGYEIGEWFTVTPESIKRVKLRAERSKDDGFRVAFDPDEF